MSVHCVTVAVVNEQSITSNNRIRFMMGQHCQVDKHFNRHIACQNATDEFVNVRRRFDV